MSKRKTKDTFAFNKNKYEKPDLKVQITDIIDINPKGQNVYPEYKLYMQKLKEVTDEAVKWCTSPEYRRKKLFETIQVVGTKWIYENGERFWFNSGRRSATMINKIDRNEECITLAVNDEHISVVNLTKRIISKMDLYLFKPVEHHKEIVLGFNWNKDLNAMIDSVEILDQLTKEQIEIHKLLYM